MISVITVSLNEAKKVESCLQGVSDFADELIVVDLGSKDDIEEICKKFSAKFFKHKFVPFVERVRNFAISKATGDWILVLDPDEKIGEKLKEKLREISKKDDVAAVNIPRRNIFFGGWIVHTNFWPDRHIRFFKKGKVAWNEKIHSYPKVSGKVLELAAHEELAILHFGYDSISQFIDRQNRYSEIEAQQRYAEGERFSLRNFIWQPTREFLVRFIKHKGFLDGIYGLSLTILLMIYRVMISVKIWELEKKR